MPTRLRAADRAFVEAATQRFRKELTDIVTEHEGAGHDAGAALGDPEAFATRVVRASVPVPSPWDSLIGPFIRSEGVQARLAVSRQAVAASAARRRLLRVITADGVHLYPLWQFDGPGVLAGLAPVLALFTENRVDGWTLAGWLRTTDPELGEPPYDALIRGEHARVLSAARSAAASLGA